MENEEVATRAVEIAKVLIALSGEDRKLVMRHANKAVWLSDKTRLARCPVEVKTIPRPQSIFKAVVVGIGGEVSPSTGGPKATKQLFCGPGVKITNKLGK